MGFGAAPDRRGSPPGGSSSFSAGAWAAGPPGCSDPTWGAGAPACRSPPRGGAPRAPRLAAAHGISATVHAIGDAAVRRALDLLEPLPRAALPHRIEHFQCVHEADLGRAARAGIVLSMQPAHLLVDIPLAERHWGRRGRGAYAFGTLAALGSQLAFGSDAPVAPLDPRPGVFAAMDRRAPGAGRDAAWYATERMAFESVVRAYTEGPARAAGWAPRLGALRTGSAAGLVAWGVGPAASEVAGGGVPLVV